MELILLLINVIKIICCILQIFSKVVLRYSMQLVNDLSTHLYGTWTKYIYNLGFILTDLNIPHLTTSQVSVGYMALWKKWTLTLHVFNWAIFMSSPWLPQRLAENFWRNMKQYLHPGPLQWRLSIQVVASWPQQWCHGETSGRRWEGFSLLMWLIHQHLGGYMTREWKKRTILFDAFITSVRSLLAITALAQLSTSEIQSVNTAEMPSGRWSSTQDTSGQGKKDGGPGVEEEQHVESLFTVLAHLYVFSLSDYFPWLRVLDLDGHEKTVREAMNTIKKYHDPNVDQRVEQWRNGEKEAEDLLDFLISVKDSNGEPLLSVAEIKAQCAVR